MAQPGGTAGSGSALDHWRNGGKLFAGRQQPFPRPVKELKHGVSITDACLGWDVTERMLRWGAGVIAEGRTAAVSVFSYGCYTVSH